MDKSTESGIPNDLALESHQVIQVENYSVTWGVTNPEVINRVLCKIKRIERVSTEDPQRYNTIVLNHVNLASIAS